MPQLTFKWPTAPSYALSDFIVSPANAEAAGFLERWPEAGQHTAIVSGPEASGKTHLASVWTARTGAVTINASQLGGPDSAALWLGRNHAVLENIETVKDETALFHLLRHGESHGLFLLLTSRVNARDLPFTLADLRSRLLALPGAAIGAPDEELLKGFLLKCFSDQQLRVGEEVAEYLSRRIERSFLAARACVELLAERALETGREITVPLARMCVR